MARRAYKRCKSNLDACVLDYNDPYSPIDYTKPDDPENLVMACGSDPEETSCGGDEKGCACFIVVIEYEFRPGIDKHIKLGDEQYFDSYPSASPTPHYLTKAKATRDFGPGGDKRWAIICACLKIDDQLKPIPV